MKKKEVERSGVARCQKCFKYGHYTYQCPNQPTYRYRPSRTMQYKQKLKMEIKSTKPPKVSTVNPDYKRRVIDDGPSSDSEQIQVKAPQVQKDIKLQQKEVQGEPKPDQKSQPPNLQNNQQQEQSDSSSDSSSSSESSSSSSEQEDPAPRKRKPN